MADAERGRQIWEANAFQMIRYRVERLVEARLDEIVGGGWGYIISSSNPKTYVSHHFQYEPRPAYAAIFRRSRSYKLFEFQENNPIIFGGIVIKDRISLFLWKSTYRCGEDYKNL